MSDKIIDFNKSKEKLISKKYPNISKVDDKNKKQLFTDTNLAFDAFQDIFYKYQEYLSDRKNNKEVKIDEVLIYFNRYFDELYNNISAYDSSKTTKFKEILDYAMLSNGKRLRPFLMLVIYNFCKGDDMIILGPFLVAIEMIHTFSLIHDDLPCIDNDELRRGKLTVWKKYGEDMAVLAGDALYMQAMTILADYMATCGFTEYAPYIATSNLILSKLSGLEGMIIGEVFDVMNTSNDKLSMEDLQYMYDKKTTALIVASIVIGANMSMKANENIDWFEKLGILLGEAYQIQDDLLEIESTEEKIGKSVNSDIKNGKITMVSKLGIESSKIRFANLYMVIEELIVKLTNDSNLKEALVLKDVMNYIMIRDK